MKNRSRSMLSLAVALAALATVGCSTADAINNKIDCHTVCKRYADCFKSDYDVDGCSDKCENSADSDEERQRKLRACDACIDDRSCTAATFNCSDECLGIVP